MDRVPDYVHKARSLKMCVCVPHAIRGYLGSKLCVDPLVACHGNN
jgi:hypothetical protein